METTKRTLGRSGVEISALGMGCWAIGGPYSDGTSHYGWGDVDDAESIRGVRRALELGVTFFDTASSYGAGHSEVVLGQALGGVRADVVVASKWGYTFDEASRTALGMDDSVPYLRSCLEGSLRRLGTDYVDVYQLHIGDMAIPQALEFIEPLEELVAEGKLRGYGWSTDDPERAAAFAEAGPHCVAVQYDMSVLADRPAMVETSERLGLAGIIRGPLAMGLLSGKYADGRAVAANDIRAMDVPWMTYFQAGAGAPEWVARVERLREIFATGGRTPAQGALAWLWARSETAIPIPGFRSVQQVEQNAGALELGPLSKEEFAAVEDVLAELRGGFAAE
ncbi:aldo/keto reductase [Hamadaea tsunoensis]|uniref:aldo/keto reductase n=1 Tax=Hamadaea tsunoensis TaxID=53368 RepID=UPI0003F8F3BF|nr:aldo/keto reductase [Hamadaea tsunoensis]